KPITDLKQKTRDKLKKEFKKYNNIGSDEEGDDNQTGSFLTNKFVLVVPLACLAGLAFYFWKKSQKEEK
ncbi:MAG: hypothetical protein AAF443_08890, partial [Chlamydiota bacterium]